MTGGEYYRVQQLVTDSLMQPVQVPHVPVIDGAGELNLDGDNVSPRIQHVSQAKGRPRTGASDQPVLESACRDRKAIDRPGYGVEGPLQLPGLGPITPSPTPRS